MTDNNENKVLNVPHLRFPKFSGEWEICKVSELLDFYSTNSLSWEQLEYGEKAMMNLHFSHSPLNSGNLKGGTLRTLFSLLSAIIIILYQD